MLKNGSGVVRKERRKRVYMYAKTGARMSGGEGGGFGRMLMGREGGGGEG